MSIAVISYSLTGNNDALAASVAKSLSAEHIRIIEDKKRNTGAIVFDVIFNRTPRANPLPAQLKKYEQILLIAPVWMGQAASPLRIYLKYIKEHRQPYAFASISGGAMNTNPKLVDDLTKRAGSKPTAFVDLHISDLLPPDRKPTMKETSGYRLSEDEIRRLSEAVVKAAKSAAW